MNFCSKVALKKVDGSRFFWSIFDFIAPKSVLLGFIEKQAPQKALCLGPDPPPGENMKFIDFLRFLVILGPSIQPEKASAKSASTPYPHPKVNFMRFYLIATQFHPTAQQFHDSLYVAYCLLLFVFWSSTGNWLIDLRRVFLISLLSSFCSFVLVRYSR
jgi:hypothetical protein